MLKVECAWRGLESVFREEGTTCNMNIENGVTNPKILRVSYILRSLFCQHPILLLIWSFSCGMEGKRERLSEEQFWSNLYERLPLERVRKWMFWRVED